jgi:hypothetical protein
MANLMLLYDPLRVTKIFFCLSSATDTGYLLQLVPHRSGLLAALKTDSLWK